jgi:hypothetical protein
MSLISRRDDVSTLANEKAPNERRSSDRVSSSAPLRPSRFSVRGRRERTNERISRISITCIINVSILRRVVRLFHVRAPSRVFAVSVGGRD